MYIILPDNHPVTGRIEFDGEMQSGAGFKHLPPIMVELKAPTFHYNHLLFAAHGLELKEHTFRVCVLGINSVLLVRSSRILATCMKC